MRRRPFFFPERSQNFHLPVTDFEFSHTNSPLKLRVLPVPEIVMLAVFAIFGIPASTTHAITGTIMGAGAARRKRAVRWKVSRQIIFSWIITIPGSAAMGIGFTYLIHLFV